MSEDDLTPPNGVEAKETTADAIVRIAHRELALDVRETTKNRGLRIDMYHREGGGVDPSMAYPWCASFASYVVLQALGADKSRFQRGASVLKLWERNQLLRVARPEPGAIWLRLDANLKGHCGIVVGVDQDGVAFEAIEGNTGPGRAVAATDREGDGVYLRSRTVNEATGGFLVVPEEAVLHGRPTIHG